MSLLFNAFPDLRSLTLALRTPSADDLSRILIALEVGLQHKTTDLLSSPSSPYFLTAIMVIGTLTAQPLSHSPCRCGLRSKSSAGYRAGTLR